MHSLHRYLVACAIAACAGLTSVASSACSAVTRANLIACALAQNLEVHSAREALSATEGRRQAAATVLPANPTLSFSAGAPIGYALNSSSLTWSMGVAQEVEIGGQRGRRRDLADAERTAQSRRGVVTAREVALEALRAYFEALAAREQAVLARRLGAVGEALGTYARSRSLVGLLSPVESGVARAEAVRLAQLGVDAELHSQEALAALTSALGQDPTQAMVEVEGQLEPLLVADWPVERLLRGALAERAEVQVATAEHDVATRRAALLRASRLPNPTLSAFYRKDWFEERTAGIGLSFPLPLPSPVGRTFAGEISEADALARRAQLDAQRLRRDVRLAVVNAKLTFESRKRELELFTPDSITQAEDGIDAIGEALRGQKIAIRDALLSEQALVQLLLEHIQARRRVCLASVELAHAAGFALERGVQ